eukprot:scaffold109957_cov26-Tisochrysis_lutea.AAC.1
MPRMRPAERAGRRRCRHRADRAMVPRLQRHSCLVVRGRDGEKGWALGGRARSRAGCRGRACENEMSLGG